KHLQTLLSFLVILTLTLHASENKNGYNTFLKRHVRNDTPTDLNKENWKKFINRISTWNRTIQSFFPFSEKDNVEAVCSSGGKMFERNLCISKKPFSFITVKIDSHCTIKTSSDLY
uniref:Si:dkey-237j11.3 n=1 Tax=Sinocyclocheilus anshuiensis TaxID=1608454 RepID=A0A671M8E5_9TELE